MAFTRATIRNLAKESGVEIPKELEDALVTEHLNARNAYAEEQVKAELEKQPVAKAENVKDSEEYKALKADFDKYKAEVAAKETKAKANSAVRSYLESKNITGDNLDLAMMACESIIASAELDGEKLKDTTALDTLVDSKFKRLVTHTTTKGANTANPPANNGNSGVTKADFQKMSYKDRLQIYNENPDLYNELTT